MMDDIKSRLEAISPKKMKAPKSDDGNSSDWGSDSDNEDAASPHVRMTKDKGTGDAKKKPRPPRDFESALNNLVPCLPPETWFHLVQRHVQPPDAHVLILQSTFFLSVFAFPCPRCWRELSLALDEGSDDTSYYLRSPSLSSPCTHSCILSASLCIVLLQGIYCPC